MPFTRPRCGFMMDGPLPMFGMGTRLGVLGLPGQGVSGQTMSSRMGAQKYKIGSVSMKPVTAQSH
jgi:hypothetical protein